MDETEKLRWEISVPIFRNAIIVRQMAIAIGIPFGLVIGILLIASRGEGAREYSFYGLALIAAAFGLAYLVIMIAYGGKYQVGFVLDHMGIQCYTCGKQAKRNRVINGLTVALGILTRRPTAAGAGILAASQQSTSLKWRNMRKTKFHRAQYTITVHGHFAQQIAIFCTPDNYATVETFIRSRLRDLGRRVGG
ncbi:MAG: hypothetical protein KA063_05945 [Firmicutes bacterium]|nr:hypothetical protein [Bacillota bacterium]